MSQSIDESNKLLPPGITRLEVKVGESQSHYLKTGSGTPVVLLHGGASDSLDWVKIMTALSSCYCFYAPDLPGFGQGIVDRGSYHMSDFVEFTAGFIRQLGLGAPALVGHSLGGRVCLGVALSHPEMVSKMVLIDSVGLGSMTPWGSVALTGFWLMRALLKQPQPTPRILPEGSEGTSWDFQNKLPDLKTPTLLVWAQFDPYFPVSLARRAQKRMADAKLEVVPGYGHAPHKENPDYFARMLQSFLDGDCPVSQLSR